MNTVALRDMQDDAPAFEPQGAIAGWVETAIAQAPNKARLQRQLDAISSDAGLLRFLHRFVLFNDALAARVPFVAGLIHLSPDLFLEPEPGVAFCRQANGRVAAYVAEAAADEYRLVEGQDTVHQHLSQIFLNGVLAHFGVDCRGFDGNNPFPPALAEMLKEVREKFLLDREPETIFAALGFHVGLEFFAHQEFNLVDAHLRQNYPELVAALTEATSKGQAYSWLAIHTVVEIGHYRAGLRALTTALHYYREPTDAPKMAERIKEGFSAFVDLQSRYYDAILRDA